MIDTLQKEDIHAYLDRHQKKELLRFLTCGSVDDGKSTLIGRLLHDTKMIYEDQLAAVKRDSEKFRSEEGAFALPDLRQRRRQQEHAHRPAAARHQDDLRGPARRRETRQREG